MFCYICVCSCVKGLSMYSKEFMKFLYGYQKEDFKPKEQKNIEIRFKNNGNGKLAEVFLTVRNK